MTADFTRKLLCRVFLTIAPFVIGASLPGCTAVNSQTEKPEPVGKPLPMETPPQKEETKQFTNGRVEFKGVSLNYNPQIFESAEAEEIAAQPLENKTDKPEWNFPRHVKITLAVSPAKNAKAGETERLATIEVLPIVDYRRMYEVSEDYTKYFDEDLRELRKEIKNEKLSVKSGVTFLPYMDAHRLFIAKVKRAAFGSGQGFFFLTEYSQDYAELVSNDGLVYYYQGMTNDGKNYIFAQLPVTVSFLPDQGFGQFEGYKLPPNSAEFDKNKKPYRQYLTKITKRIESLPPHEFKPNLSEFEQIIQSLRVEK